MNTSFLSASYPTDCNMGRHCGQRASTIRMLGRKGLEKFTSRSLQNLHLNFLLFLLVVSPRSLTEVGAISGACKGIRLSRELQASVERIASKQALAQSIIYQRIKRLLLSSGRSVVATNLWYSALAETSDNLRNRRGLAIQCSRCW